VGVQVTARALLFGLLLLGSGCASWYASNVTAGEVVVTSDGDFEGVNESAASLARMGREALPTVLEHADEEAKRDRTIEFRILTMHIVEADPEWADRGGWRVRARGSEAAVNSGTAVPEDAIRVTVGCLGSQQRHLRLRALHYLSVFRDPRTFEALIGHFETVTANCGLVDSREVDATVWALRETAFQQGPLVRADAPTASSELYPYKDPWPILILGHSQKGELRDASGKRAPPAGEIAAQLRKWLEGAKDKLPAQVK
jgi:hypothetical protein